MDKQLVQITDLVKDYAKIIDELREENKSLKAKCLTNAELIWDKQDEIQQRTP